MRTVKVILKGNKNFHLFCYKLLKVRLTRTKINLLQTKGKAFVRFDLSFFFLTCLADTCAHALIHNPELRSAAGCVCFGDGQPTETMQLHFTKDVLPDSVGTDFQNLNKLNEQVSPRL